MTKTTRNDRSSESPQSAFFYPLGEALILGRTHGAVRRWATIVRRQLGLLT